jgi:ribosomal protein L12E/L44/L45/RPP1/RPP2
MTATVVASTKKDIKEAIAATGTGTAATIAKRKVGIAGCRKERTLPGQGREEEEKTQEKKRVRLIAVFRQRIRRRGKIGGGRLG